MSKITNKKIADKKISAEKAQRASLFWLYGTFISSLTALYLLSYGCSQNNADLSAEVLGPEVSPSQIATDVYKAINLSTAEKIKAGEALLYEQNQRVDLNSVIKTSDQIIQVTNVDDLGDKVQIGVDVQINKYDGVGNKTSDNPVVSDVIVLKKTDFSFPLSVGKSTSQSIAPNMMESLESKVFNPSTKNLLHLLGIVSSGKFSSEKKTLAPYGTYQRMTFHKFIVRKIQKDPPELVKELPNCLNIPNCKINVTEVQFVIAKWKNATDWDSEKHILLLSQETPAYFGNVLSHCVSQFYPIQDPSTGKTSNIYATLCDVLRDFRFE